MPPDGAAEPPADLGALGAGSNLAAESDAADPGDSPVLHRLPAAVIPGAAGVDVAEILRPMMGAMGALALAQSVTLTADLGPGSPDNGLSALRTAASEQARNLPVRLSACPPVRLSASPRPPRPPWALHRSAGRAPRPLSLPRCRPPLLRSRRPHAGSRPVRHVRPVLSAPFHESAPPGAQVVLRPVRPQSTQPALSARPGVTVTVLCSPCNLVVRLSADGDASLRLAAALMDAAHGSLTVFGVGGDSGAALPAGLHTAALSAASAPAGGPLSGSAEGLGLELAFPGAACC